MVRSEQRSFLPETHGGLHQPRFFIFFVDCNASHEACLYYRRILTFQQTILLAARPRRKKEDINISTYVYIYIYIHIQVNVHIYIYITLFETNLCMHIYVQTISVCIYIYIYIEIISQVLKICTVPIGPIALSPQGDCGGPWRVRSGRSSE